MNKLWVRLSLGFGGMVLAAVLLVAITGILAGPNPRFVQVRVMRRLSGELADIYRAEGNLQAGEKLLNGAQAVYRQGLDRDLALFLVDPQQRVIFHPRRDAVGQPVEQVARMELMPIRVDDQIVGYLGLGPAFNRRPPPGPFGFLGFLGWALLTVAAATGLSAVIFGILMSRSLTAPLNRLAEAARAIGARRLGWRVEEKGSDEMIAVARAFNEMAADLEQAEQLRRNLLADVAHELRTPLSVLQGNLRAILDEVYPLDQAEMARLYEQTRFLSRLVTDLHELAQAEAQKLPLDLHPTDLGRLVEAAVDVFRPAAESKEIALKIEVPPDLPPAPVDAARIRQVLQNLLANALRHTPSQGTITVELRSEPDAVLLSVIDTGEGIPSEHLPHIFDRFYRTDPARSRDRGGAGLGLAIARAIVEAHGGQIQAASRGGPGQGTTFTIRLPLTQPDSAGSSAPASIR